MNRESKCQHDIDEQETAVAEHLCPLCLADRVAELEAKLADIAGLAEKWRADAARFKWANDAPAYNHCANELQAVLDKATRAD